MGSYNSQYENYYNSISSRANMGRRPKLGKSKKNYFDKVKIIRLVKIQLIGTLVLFSTVFVCKVFVTPQTKAIYSFGKSTVNKNYDIKSIINYASSINLSDTEQYIKNVNFKDIENNVVNFIDTQRAKFTGTKTIKEQINQEFAAPVSKKISLFSASSSEKKAVGNGVEFFIPINSEIYTVYDGSVEEIGENKVDGKYIVIDHGNGIETRYAHLNLIYVKKGSKVNKDQAIAKSGNTGQDKSSSLYFELIYMGEKLNPMEYIKI